MISKIYTHEKRLPYTSNRRRPEQRALALIFALSGITGCSRLIQWDEEVPLNTGKTIWVHRSTLYKKVLSGPLALDLEWQAEIEKIDFEWNGNSFSFTGKRSKDLLPIVLFIDPKLNEPVFIAPLGPATQWGCHRPHYAELRFRKSTWEAHTSIPSEAHGIRSNLLVSRPDEPINIGPIITSQARNKADSIYETNFRSGFLRFVDPNYVTDNCRGKVQR